MIELDELVEKIQALTPEQRGRSYVVASPLFIQRAINEAKKLRRTDAEENSVVRFMGVQIGGLPVRYDTSIRDVAAHIVIQ